MKLLDIIFKSTLIIILNLVSLISFGQNNTITVLTDLGTRYDYAHSIAIQSDGKVVVAGDANGTPCMIRFDTTGALDNTFGSGGKVFANWSCGSNPADNDIKIQSDGNIVFGTRYYNGNDDDFVIARLNSNGTFDNDFGNNGKTITPFGNYNDYCNAIAIQSNGKILAGGGVNNSEASNYNYDFALIRYNTNGTIDSTFGNHGKISTHIGLSNNMAYSIALQKDEKIILAGEANDSIFSDFALVRYDTNGLLDNSFGNGGIVRIALSETYDYANSVALQSDEKIIVTGFAQYGLTNNNFALVRYNTDGSLDSTFGTNGIVITHIDEGYGNSVAIAPDNKIILAGSCYTSTTISNVAALRYNIDGSLDNSFGANGLITTSFGNGDSNGSAVAIGNDGEILIAGYYNHGSPRYFDFALVRLFSKLTVIQSPPTLLSPPDGATGQSTEPTMTWDIISGAISYNIQMSTSPEFDTEVISCTGLTSPSFTVSGLNNNTTYYWKVNCNSVVGTSVWSDTWNFSTIAFTDITEHNTEQLKLYPIPIIDKLFIDGIYKELTTISILSIEGKLIKQIRGFNIEEIDLSDIQNGMYILKILNSNINYSKKIIKQ